MQTIPLTQVVLKPIPSQPGFFAGDDGHIYDSMLKQRPEFPMENGYLGVFLRRGKTRVHKTVHRLIAEAFLGTPGRRQTRHSDGSRTNNVPKNLLWGTAQDNADDRHRHGRTAKGEESGPSKLTASQVIDIKKRLESGERRSQIAADFGVCVRTVGAIIEGRSWRWLQA